MIVSGTGFFLLVFRAIPVVRTGFIGSKTNAFFFATPVAAPANLILRVSHITALTIPVAAVTGLFREEILVTGIAVPGKVMLTRFVGGIDALLRLPFFACGAVTVGFVRTGSDL